MGVAIREVNVSEKYFRFGIIVETGGCACCEVMAAIAPGSSHAARWRLDNMVALVTGIRSDET